jgi:hypothetical protein
MCFGYFNNMTNIIMLYITKLLYLNILLSQSLYNLNLFKL